MKPCSLSLILFLTTVVGTPAVALADVAPGCGGCAVGAIAVTPGLVAAVALPALLIAGVVRRRRAG